MLERLPITAWLAVLLLLSACGDKSTNDSPLAMAGAGGAAPAGGGNGGAAAAPGMQVGPIGAGGVGAGGGAAGNGAAGSPAPTAGSSGATGASGAGTAGASDASVPDTDAGPDAQMMPTGPATGSFPPIADPWATGPFAVATLRSAGPARNATVLYPRDLGRDGLKHPIVVWDNGAGQTGLSIYSALLNHLASHGFAVYAANSATDMGAELTAGLDWMIEQAGMSGSPFYQKLDTTRTASMGHSQGSIATFAISGDKRLTTTIHLSGGTNPEIAQGHDTLPNLHKPAAFICGEPGGDGLVVGDVASEWCAYDFEHTDVPVFLAQITGASHISAPGMTLGACAAWLRWHLMDDTTQRAQFVGPDCTLCMRRNWVAKSKGL
ncbi:MAG TPA: hypothetical protein VK509_00910 [Polyangiales bacterium]|nr:hypothetical protein [Polyangiales bacterium]